MMNYLNIEDYLNLNKITKDDIVDALYANFSKDKIRYAALTGSVVQGHGTITSDLDLNILIEDEIEDCFGVYNVIVKGVRIDIEFASISFIDSIYDFLNGIEFKSESQNYVNHQVSSSISNDNLFEFFGRIYSGLKIIDYNGIFDKLQLIFDDGIYLYSYHSKRVVCENIYEDIVGFLNNGDYISAYAQGVTLLNYTCMAYLLKKNVYIDRAKWVNFYLSNEPKLQEYYHDYLKSDINEETINYLLDYCDQLLVNVIG